MRKVWDLCPGIETKISFEISLFLRKIGSSGRKKQGILPSGKQIIYYGNGLQTNV